ncbi:MAG: hypothetical protein K2J59_02135 [Eubacterium sp.]|nr:hypothetical protein [Eubacterium sp.]
MKRVLKLSIVSLLLFSFIIPYTAFAETSEVDAQRQGIVEISEEEFYSMLPDNFDSGISTYASGLISSYIISIGQDGNKLTILGITRGVVDVKKCGFTKVTLQQRKNSSSSWTDYKTYKDLYKEQSIYNLCIELFVPKEYQYRVICTHYAKKNAFSTEKIDNSTKVYQF